MEITTNQVQEIVSALTSDDDMLEFKYEYINHKYYVTFLNRLKG